MMNSKDLFRDLQKRITLVQELSETDSMLYLMLENMLNITRADIIAQKPVSIPPDAKVRLEDAIHRINQHEPIQYILGKAYFYGYEFLVNPSVLIPRPETELLVDEILKATSDAPGKIVDLGTGSGCIAITLAKKLPQKTVMAIDVSERALQTATENAKNLNVRVDFQRMDILKDEFMLEDVECIVSNPPYVALSEKETMQSNVLNYEPHGALFVPDTNPLVFYKVIAQKGKRALKVYGRIVVEVNERFGMEVCDIFTREGFEDVRLMKDLQSKDRIVSAIKKSEF